MANVRKCKRSECEFNCGGCYCELDEISIDEYGQCEDYAYRTTPVNEVEDFDDECPDYDDDDIEMGFNPYSGCYDYDC